MPKICVRSQESLLAKNCVMSQAVDQSESRKAIGQSESEGAIIEHFTTTTKMMDGVRQALHAFQEKNKMAAVLVLRAK